MKTEEGDIRISATCLTVGSEVHLQLRAGKGKTSRGQKH